MRFRKAESWSYDYKRYPGEYSFGDLQEWTARELQTHVFMVANFHLALGDQHLNIATSYNNLANVYEKQEEYKKAITYYLKAYKIFLSIAGNGHPSTQAIYKNMEQAYYQWNPQSDFHQWLEKKMKSKEITN